MEDFLEDPINGPELRKTTDEIMASKEFKAMMKYTDPDKLKDMVGAIPENKKTFRPIESDDVGVNLAKHYQKYEKYFSKKRAEKLNREEQIQSDEEIKNPDETPEKMTNMENCDEQLEKYRNFADVLSKTPARRYLNGLLISKFIINLL